MSGIGIVELLTALGGYECIKWLITFWVHRKQEKRLKDAEVGKAESEVGKSKVAEEKAVRDMYEETLTEMRKEYVERINELRHENSEQSKQILELLKAGGRKDDIIADKVAKLRELQELRVEDARQIGKLEKSLQFFKSWKCFREYGKGDKECDRREPQQNPPLKYNPLDEGTSDDAS